MRQFHPVLPLQCDLTRYQEPLCLGQKAKLFQKFDKINRMFGPRQYSSPRCVVWALCSENHIPLWGQGRSERCSFPVELVLTSDGIAILMCHVFVSFWSHVGSCETWYSWWGISQWSFWSASTLPLRVLFHGFFCSTLVSPVGLTKSHVHNSEYLLQEK